MKHSQKVVKTDREIKRDTERENVRERGRQTYRQTVVYQKRPS